MKKLNRAELLELLLEESSENEQLRSQLAAQKKYERETPDGEKIEKTFDRKALESELKQENYKRRYFSVLRNTIGVLIVAAAISVLVATLWLPVLRIYGSSMTPALSDGEIVISVRTSHFEPGDIVAFDYSNKILVKRVICEAGDWIDIDEDGTVYVNGTVLEEPYLDEKALGECDIELPYQVPDRRIFVMGDHRSTSIDSRSTTIGCVSQEQIVGKIIFRIWPLTRLGL